MKRTGAFYFFKFFLVLSFCLIWRLPAQAGAEREFIMSCTYGVLAGTLVGAASLAFVDRPGDNLQRVARGASIGLYLGIGLGLYTVYFLPKQIEEEGEKLLEEETGEIIEGEPYTHLPRWMVIPLVAENKIDGAAALWRVSSF